MAERAEQGTAAALPLPAGGALRFGAARKRAGLLLGFLLSKPLLTAARTKLAAALATEAERGALFLCVPVLLGFGAVLYFAAPFEPSLALLLAAACGGATAMFLLRRRRIGFLALAAGTLCLAGMLAGKVETLRFSTKMLGAEVTTRITGRIVRVDHLAANRVRLLIDVLGTERPRLRFAPDLVRVTAAKVSTRVEAGMAVRGLVRLMPPSGPTMPGGYDFSFQSFFSGIGASGFFLGAPQVSARDGPATIPAAWKENVRERIANRIRSRIGGAEGEIAAALTVGIRGGIPEAVNEALRRTGLAHVLSISGLHMALVAATVMGGARALLACFPGLASRRPVKKFAAGAALLVICGYLVFSGADVAAVRSFLMLAVMLVAVLFDRAALSVRNLAIAAAIILLLWPHEVLGPSFQMSFAATGALVAGYAAWAEHRTNRGGPRPALPLAMRALGRGGELVLALAATSIIAGAATAVFGIFHFQRVSPLSLPANLAVMPVVSVLVMPFALLAMLAMPFGLDAPFLAVMGLGLRWMILITQWFSERSPLDAVGAIPALSLVSVAAALLVFTLTTTWLRLLAVPLALGGIVLALGGSRANVFVSEDARLVGVVLEGGQLAVNASRGGGFTLENWLHASAASAVARPEKRPEENKGSPPDPATSPRFRCESGLCRLRLPDGRSIVHAATQRAASSVCSEADVLIVAEPALRSLCPANPRQVVLTKRDLALQGSAALRFGPETAAGAATVTFSVPQPLRPWHDHRRFSRAARGLADMERKRKSGDDAQPAAE